MLVLISFGEILSLPLSDQLQKEAYFFFPMIQSCSTWAVPYSM